MIKSWYQQLFMVMITSNLLTGVCTELHGLPQMPQFSMPKMPTISMPNISIPKVSLPKVSMPTRESFSNLSMPKFSRPKMTVADVRSMVGRHKGKVRAAAVALLALGGTELASAELEKSIGYKLFLRKWIKYNTPYLLKSIVVNQVPPKFSYTEETLIENPEKFSFVSKEVNDVYRINPELSLNLFLLLHPYSLAEFKKQDDEFKILLFKDSTLNEDTVFLALLKKTNFEGRNKDAVYPLSDDIIKQLYPQIVEFIKELLLKNELALRILLSKTNGIIKILCNFHSSIGSPYYEQLPLVEQFYMPKGNEMYIGENLWGKALTDIRDQVKKKMPSRFYLYWKYLTGSK